MIEPTHCLKCGYPLAGSTCDNGCREPLVKAVSLDLDKIRSDSSERRTLLHKPASERLPIASARGILPDMSTTATLIQTLKKASADELLARLKELRDEERAVASLLRAVNARDRRRRAGQKKEPTQ